MHRFVGTETNLAFQNSVSLVTPNIRAQWIHRDSRFWCLCRCRRVRGGFGRLPHRCPLPEHTQVLQLHLQTRLQGRWQAVRGWVASSSSSFFFTIHSPPLLVSSSPIRSWCLNWILADPSKTEYTFKVVGDGDKGWDRMILLNSSFQDAPTVRVPLSNAVFIAKSSFFSGTDGSCSGSSHLFWSIGLLARLRHRQGSPISLSFSFKLRALNNVRVLLEQSLMEKC